MSKFTIEKDWIHKDLRCVVMMSSMGHRCGYVGINELHPLYSVNYSDSPDILKDKLEELKNSEIGKRGAISLFCWDGESVSPSILFDVHGGITFSDGGKESKYPVESDLWWFGYDCAHCGDAKDLSVVNDTIKEIELKYPTGGTLRTLEYCVSECESLAEQIHVLV